MTIDNIGRYQLEAHLGSGAYADVYKAVDTLLERPVALKVLKPALAASPEAMQRFFKEAKVLANLQHDQIAWVWDLGEADGRYFLAVRYVEGKSLDRVLEEHGSLPWADALAITQDVASALAFAHGRSLVHRDVKPGNIIISESEGAVLTDFGLVKALDSSGMTTTSAGALGTLAYMAPEVLNGEPATPAADVFGLACVLVEMLTGKGPFDAPTPQAMITKHFLPLQLPEKWPEGCPAELGAGIEKAMAQEAAERTGLADFIRPLSDAAGAQTVSQEVVPPRAEIVKSPVQKAAPVGTSAGDEMVIQLAEGVEMVFVRVPAGEFWMGSDEDDPDAYGDEKPRHKVYLDAYWMGKYPVTNAQYAAFVKANGSEKPTHWERGEIPVNKGMHPVVNVSWQDAQAFCLWASTVSGKAVHLPSEAQWEKAARGTDERKYPWGDEMPNPRLLNFSSNVGDTTAVGSYPAGVSPYGALDMAGNVWEWVADWYDAGYYSKSPAENPTGPSSGDRRVLRGGSWNDSGGVVRSADRVGIYPVNSLNYLGFRCASSP